MATRRRSMSVAEEDAFVLTLDEIMGELESFSDNMEEEISWLKRALLYNVTGGKQIRGRGVVAAFRGLGGMDMSAIRETYILGWCIEIMQASLLMASDIMDNSETRRGRICWYLREKVGDLAISDAIVLSGIVNMILDRYFSEKDYYAQLTELFHSVSLRASLGQCIDIHCSKKEKACRFTMDNYKKIVKYKTSCTSFLLPVSCAMIMAGKVNEVDLRDIQELVLDMGYLFQVQDDYLDCYGDHKVTGKIGTGISGNRCTWLIVKAFEKADAGQKKILNENYGRGRESTPMNETNVRKVFETLKIPQEYSDFEDSFYKSICDRIENLGDKIPTSIFAETAEVIYRRKK